MAYSAAVPVLPMLAAEFELGATGVGMILSAPSLSRLLTNLYFGRLADRKGRKPLMVMGNLILGLASMGAALSGSVYSMLTMRLFQGLGGAASSAGSSAYTADVTSNMPQHVGKVVGVQQAIVAAAFAAGPAIGGVLAENYGSRVGFFGVGVASCLISTAYFTLPETRRESKGHLLVDEPKKATQDVPYSKLLRDPQQQACIIATAALWLSWACEISVIVVHATKALDATPSQVGYMFAMVWAVQAIGTPLGGWLADRFGKKQVIVPSFGAAAVCMALLSVADTAGAFVAALASYCFLSSLTMPALSAFSIGISRKEIRGASLSLHRQATDIVWLIGPVSLGLLADYTSTGVAVGTTAGFGLLSSLFFWLRATEVWAIPTKKTTARKTTRRRT